MVKSKISKIILIIFILITCISTRVFADGQLDLGDITGEEPEDLTGEIEDNDDPEDGDEGNDDPEDGDESNDDPEDGDEGNDDPEDGSSEYEESDIPYAGPADTILMITLFITLAGISGFTFIKLSEYNNI